eukprot:Seg1010.8 transcript_id=Seg1010.8/GoldUCD/mRNA.D3Y31 product="hypothetical protein" protein_id=Seg1010.8/GoldUCD/D3Y31
MKRSLGAIAVYVLLFLIDDGHCIKEKRNIGWWLQPSPSIVPPPPTRTRPTTPPPTPIGCRLRPGGPMIQGSGGIMYAYIVCLERASHLFRNMLFTERDETHHLWNGHTIDWANWNTYMPDLVDRCASKAKAHWFKSFAVSYYGECWADQRMTDTIQYYSSSMRNNAKCVREGYQSCSVDSKQCVGKDHGFAVYQFDPIRKRK